MANMFNESKIVMFIKSKAIIIIFFVSILYAYYLWFRAIDAMSFQSRLLFHPFYVDYTVDRKGLYDMYKKHSCYELLFSFKPLEVKYWFTKDEIETYKLYLIDERKNK